MATKKDIEELTQLVEAVKFDFEKNKYRFTKLHEKRCEVIGELYKKINTFYMALHNLTDKNIIVVSTVEEARKQMLTAAINAFVDFRDYYANHKLYFGKSTRVLLDEFKDSTFSAFIDNTEIERVKDQKLEGEELKEAELDAFKLMHNANSLVRKEIPKVREKLEEEFQKLLGLEEETK